MNDFFTFIFGIAMFVGILWLLLQAGLLEKTPVDQDEDGAQSERDVARIVEASRPAPLEEQRPHIRANTAYGKAVK